MVFFTLVISVIIGLRRRRFIFMWICIELNSIVFRFYLRMNIKNRNLPSVTIVYFIIQSVRSTLFVGLMLFTLMGFYNNFLLFGLVLSILVKLGMYPTHVWVLRICSRMNWNDFLVLMTVQKFLPLSIFSIIRPSNFVVMIFCVLGAAVRVISCFTLTSLQKILVYSSVFYMRWILLIVNKNFRISILFLRFYSVMLSLLVGYFNRLSCYRIQQLFKKNISWGEATIGFVILSRMGGLPPTIGFTMKLMIMKELWTQISLFVLIVLIILSLVILYYYLRIIFGCLSWYKISFRFTFYKIYNWNYFSIMSLNFVSMVYLFNLIIR